MKFSYLISQRLQACSCLLLLMISIRYAVAASVPEQHQTYIIHLDHSHKPRAHSTHDSWYRSILRSLPDALDEEETLLYSYNHVMHGFSARLTASQVAAIEKSEAHIATYPESFGKMFTTRTPKFLGLDQESGIWPEASYGEGVIIGMLDTGIWPESESFSDTGMPPVPKRWKGVCENGTAFSPSVCNRKLIGARSFSKGIKAAGLNLTVGEYDSARDAEGHGTHTSSTAAGAFVPAVSHFGYARGMARGIAPRAHVAMYKVLFQPFTLETTASDVLAGMDQAIKDGVDIMSLSLGLSRDPYFKDVIAIASLSAIERGIFVVCAAGNDGAVYNAAPWITTIGAGTIDRTFTARMTLANGLTIEGTSYFPESILIRDSPIYYGRGDQNKEECNTGAFNQSEVHGKIVLCNSTRSSVDSKKDMLSELRAYAAIFISDMPDMDPDDYTIPCMVLSTTAAKSLVDYVTESSAPRIETMRFVNTNLGTTPPAPQVARFSSKGPDPINPTILKPDVIAPGVDVLAATKPRPYITVRGYTLWTDYVLESGTSMAAPHVAGIAALLKNLHPEWSPAAIRSAIMTTAYTRDNTNSTIRDQWTGLPGTPLAFGSGHVDPNKAMNPGIIYDMNLQDYIDFLCGLGYTEEQMRAVLRRREWICSNQSTDLNYPSVMTIFSNGTVTKKFIRTVTNVGAENSIYQAKLDLPPGLKVLVEPTTLSFTERYQTRNFTITVEDNKVETPSLLYGFLKWVDQHNHVASSPIVAIKK